MRLSLQRPLTVLYSHAGDGNYPLTNASQNGSSRRIPLLTEFNDLTDAPVHSDGCRAPQFRPAFSDGELSV